MAPLTRRNFFRTGAVVIVGGALAVSADAAIFEPNHPQLVRLEIHLPRLPAAWDGFTIAQLSDFHYDEHFSAVPIRKAVEMVNDLHPDLVVLTGDFITVPLVGSRRDELMAAQAIAPCAGLLRPLRGRLGTLAVLGNHDAGSDHEHIVKVLEANGIPVLRNRSLPLQQAGAQLWIAGVDDVVVDRADLAKALHGIPAGDPVVLLAHEPDFADHTAQFPVDLQLSGHSHGGQVRLPWLGAPVLPDLGRRYPWGLHRISDLMLYTNVGIGTIRLPVRLNCPPEVTLITLRAGSA